MRFCKQALLYFAAALLVAAAASAAPPWQPNLEAAQRVASQSGRLILIHFWGPGCAPCMRVERDVFSRPQALAALEPHFVLVKINAEEAPATTRAYGVSSIPTDVIVTSRGQLVSQCNSPLSAQQYVGKMTQIAMAHRQLLERDRYSARPAPAPSATQQRAGQPQPTRSAQSPPAGAPAAQAAYTQASIQLPTMPPVYSQPSSALTTPPPVHQPTPPAAQIPYASQTPAGLAQPPLAQQRPPVSNAAVQLRPGSAPLALDGYCPVQLVDKRDWKLGDARWGAVHRGRTYLFAGPEEQKRFLANPYIYSPAMEGNDPVAATDHGRVVPGSRTHGLFCEGRIYLFTDEDSLARFQRNPTRYSAEVLQAERAGSLRR